MPLRLLFSKRLHLPRTARQSRALRRPWVAGLTLLSWLVCAELGAAPARTELKLESWRKDDQIFWAQKILPAFHKLHPEIRVTFAPENPLEYDSRLDAKLTSRQGGDLIFCRPYDKMSD